jgi:hypothetical protein
MKNYKKTLFGFGLLLSISFSQTAWDAIHITENEEGFGARALAMGGAYTAIANDYSGIYWNPAGLADMKKSGFHAELSHLQFSNEALYSGQLTNNNQGFTRLKSLGFVMPLPTTQGSLVIAGGFNRISDFDDHLYFDGIGEISNDLGFEIEDEFGDVYFYPFDENVYREEEVRNEGSLRQWSLGGAIALSPNFTMGITTSLVHGKEEYNFAFRQIDDIDIYNVYPGDFDEYSVNQYLQSDYYALNLKLGGIVELNNLIKVGGVITFPSTYYIEENHSFSDILYFDDGTYDPYDESGTWDYHVKTPFIFDAGAAVTNKLFTLSGSARYRDWSQTRFEVADFELDDQAYHDIIAENSILAREYDQTIEYRLGGEVMLPGLSTKLRGGYSLVPSPIRNSDEDSKTFSAGVSFMVDNNISLDLTIIKKDWTRESWDMYTPGGVSESINTNKVLIGISYNL